MRCKAQRWLLPGPPRIRQLQRAGGGVAGDGPVVGVADHAREASAGMIHVDRATFQWPGHILPSFREMHAIRV